MTDRLHLLPRHRARVLEILRENLPGVEVWAYGSRVTGRSHQGSDLDLVLRGPALRPIALDALQRLHDEFHDSTIPFFVQAHDWARVPPSFHEAMERDRYVLVPASSNGPEPNA